MRGRRILGQRADGNEGQGRGDLPRSGECERIELGLAETFLRRAQGEDGYWRDFLTLAGESSDWVTGYVGGALFRLGRTPSAVRALERGQHVDGGWGYHAAVPSDADSTAYAVQFLLAEDPANEAARSGLDFLVRSQLPTGGFATYFEPGPIREFMKLPEQAPISGWCSPHAEVTAAAGLALAQGGRLNEARAAWKYLCQTRCNDGLWDQYWWTTPLYAAYHATKLARALGEDRIVDELAETIGGMQNADGSFEQTPFSTALGLLLTGSERARSWMLQHQLADGSWESEPMLRIAPPSQISPAEIDHWRADSLGTGVVIRDQRRLYTTATCLMALNS